MNIRQCVTAVAIVGFGLFCVTSACAHGPSRQADYGNRIISGNLVNGGRYMLLPGSSAPLTAVELWFGVPSTGYGSAPSTSIARLAAQSVAASAPPNGASLGEYVASVGGTLTVDVFPDSVAITALVPTSNTAATIHLMTRDYFSPVVTDAGVHRAKLDLATQAILDKFDPDTVIRNGLMSGLFSAGPAHYPTLDVRDLTALDTSAVRSFAEQGFQTRRASLVVTGASVQTLQGSAVAGPFASKVDAEADAKTLTSPVASESADLSLTFRQPGNGFAWIGPDISDENAATAMDFIADYLFHPSDGKVTRLLATTEPEVTVNGQFITLRKPGVFVVSISGKGSDAAAKAARKEIAALANPLNSAEFARAQNAFIYHLESNLQNPGDFAASIGWYATEGRPGYAPGAVGDKGAYFHDASALTSDSVAAIVRRFFLSPPVTVTLQPASQEKSR